MIKNSLRIVLLLALVSLEQTAPAAPSLLRQSGTSPLKVFILAGQSNMEGQAVVDLTGKDYNDGKGTLATLIADPLNSNSRSIID